VLDIFPRGILLILAPHQQTVSMCRICRLYLHLVLYLVGQVFESSNFSLRNIITLLTFENENLLKILVSRQPSCWWNVPKQLCTYFNSGILANQLTLSQLGRADYAHHITTRPSRFSNLPPSLINILIYNSLTLFVWSKNVSLALSWSNTQVCTSSLYIEDIVCKIVFLSFAVQIGACENIKFGQFFAREIVLVARLLVAQYIETYHLQLAFISFVLLGSQSSFPINLCFKRSFCTFLVNFSIDVHILWYLLTKYFFQNEFIYIF
jgi:hypothetical protein